ALLLRAAVAVFAHAEEGEVVVAQPFEEGDGLVHGGALERRRQVAEVSDRLVETGEHRLPVAHRKPDLSQYVLQPFSQRLTVARGKARHMDMDQADAVG